jgi:hypothetical protein
MSDYKEKYLKYKNKYLTLKNLKGGIKITDIQNFNIPDHDVTITQDSPYKKIITVKKGMTVIILELYEICENETFGILTKLFTIANSNILLEIFELGIEYIIDNTKKIQTNDKFDVLELNNNNIVFLKDDIKFKILSKFDFNIGCTEEIKTRVIPGDKKYSINLIWLNRVKSINNCIIFKHKIVYSLLNETQEKEDEYVNKIEENEKINNTQFDYDGYHFNLERNIYYKDPAKKKKIYVDNFLENIKEWSSLNPSAKTNLWYDSELIEINTLIKTILLFNEHNRTNITQMGLYLRDIRKLKSLDELVNSKYDKSKNKFLHRFNGSNYINPFDKYVLGMLIIPRVDKKEEEKQYLPLYYRADLSRLLILLDELDTNMYFLYTDMDVKPLSKEYLFNENVKVNDVPIGIDDFGFMLALSDGHLENGITFVGSKYEMNKKRIISEIKKLIINLVEELPYYIYGLKEQCGEFIVKREIHQQKFHENKIINDCMNLLQEQVYYNLVEWFKDFRDERMDNLKIMGLEIDVKPSRFS